MVPSPHPGSRLDAAPDTRRESIERRILESAQALIDGGISWNQLGIRQITERAEISRTAFYDFFGSKNEVLEHLVRGLHEDLSLALRDLLDPSAQGHLDLHHLRPALAAVGEYANRHGHAYRAFLDATAEDANLAGLWSELVEAYTQLIARSIEAVRAQHQAAPRAVDARELGRTLLLMTERCLIADLLDEAKSTATSDGLVDVWERAVFGCSPAPAG